MKPPHAFNPTTLAVEDYLKRTAHANDSVLLSTVDVQGRVGSVVIYQGELWSARDTLGVGELALLRLMNERVCLHVEPLSELDRGPRTITERRHVLFMRASFETQTELDPDDPPTCILLPKPRDVRAERHTEPPAAAVTAKPVLAKPVRPLPAPKHVPQEMLTHNDARKSDRSPTTLSPLTFDAQTDTTQPSAVSTPSPLPNHTPAPARRGFRISKPKAAVAMFASTALFAAAWSMLSPQTTSVVSTFAVAAPSASDVRSKESVEVGNSNVAVTEKLALEAQQNRVDHSTASGARESVQTKPTAPVVARVRAVGSSNTLGGIDLSRYVYSITGQFLRCYDWATERAGRDALGNVSVTVRLNDEGAVDSSVASGAKIRGLNSCVADVAARLPELMHVPRAANTLRWVVAFEND